MMSVECERRDITNQAVVHSYAFIALWSAELEIIITVGLGKDSL